MADPLNVHWIHGSPNCATNTDPPLQVHAFDDDTYVWRQTRWANFEAPFLSLLFGTARALLLDTGAEPRPGQQLPIRDTVQGIISQWLARHGQPSIELVVAHSHGHGDHTFGDAQFHGQPHTKVVPPNVAGVRSFFGLADWPNRLATFDPRARPERSRPVPGQEAAHIAVYAPKTGGVRSGDPFSPGFLSVRDWKAYRHSIDRLAAFANGHPVRFFLGAHIEMTNTKQVPYQS